MSHHLPDYIITRKDCNIISDCTVTDFISDHRVHQASLQCIHPHPVRKTDNCKSTMSDKG